MGKAERDKNCKFFNGFQHSTCKAGVNYIELNGGTNDSCAVNLPCCGAFQSRRTELSNSINCPKFKALTAEEIAARDKQIDNAIKRMEKIQPWIISMKEANPNGCNKTIDTCPICKKKIAFTISSYNGHIQAACETKDCVNFIE